MQGKFQMHLYAHLRQERKGSQGVSSKNSLVCLAPVGYISIPFAASKTVIQQNNEYLFCLRMVLAKTISQYHKIILQQIPMQHLYRVQERAYWDVRRFFHDDFFSYSEKQIIIIGFKMFLSTSHFDMTMNESCSYIY